MTKTSKITSDLIFNYLMFAVMGGSGLLINFLIAWSYGSEALGVFNQALTIYLIISQFSVTGIQYSVLKYLSEFRTNNEPVDYLVSGALFGALGSSVVVLILLLLSAKTISGWFESEELDTAIWYLLPAIFFFGINKVQIAILNSLREMTLYGIAQSLRMILILVGVLVLVLTQSGSKYLVLIISIAEGIQFIVLYLLTRRFYTLSLTHSETFTWIKKHFWFGSRGLANGAVTELNSRLDVVIIGIFLSDAAVGIYVLASSVVEGLIQLLAVIRNVLNPVISEYWFSEKKRQLWSFLSFSIKRTYFSFVIISIVSIALYTLIVSHVFASEFGESIQLFIILMCGVVLASGVMPLNMALLQLGYPLTQSLYRISVVTINLGLNLLLIDEYGLKGVAVATSISFAYGGAMLYYLIRRKCHPKKLHL